MIFPMTYCETVWLIDDDELSNYLTENILQANKFSSEIRSFTNAQEALAELEASVGTELFPDFIFLDLNMPTLDGWDFLQIYRTFPEEVRGNCTLYILSSSIDEDDITRSKIHENIRDFFFKPLSKADLEVVKFQVASR
jgi:CheY-like chemotaxis protein